MTPEQTDWVAARLEPISEDARRALPADLSMDYVDWLVRTGWGDLDGAFMFYSGPVHPEDVFGDNAPSGRFVLIGDDLAGYVIGLDLERGGAVEFDPGGEEVSRWASFAAFVSERVGALFAARSTEVA
ncbi:hypothetical protein [Brevundimonas sp. FT23042]|uniref:hypothetical protein n=1 Tax=Brevundimonas sp. FT23042 TaxID=3393749 RepID=UPI003B589CB6